MKRDFITERQFITVTLRSNEWADIERLLERGMTTCRTTSSTVTPSRMTSSRKRLRSLSV
ncbi:hypothetical protein [Halomonas sp. E19]|uniref:hypothetical protein n=1 Tax=Halomonas sp. E19 TaxID=3397247 RepID=UPI0040347964